MLKMMKQSLKQEFEDYIFIKLSYFSLISSRYDLGKLIILF